MGSKGRPPKIVTEESNISWKRTRAKKALMETFPIISSNEMVFSYKEVGDKVHIRYTFTWYTFDKKNLNKYLEPLNEDVSPELSHYLDEAFKKYKNKL